MKAVRRQHRIRTGLLLLMVLLGWGWLYDRSRQPALGQSIFLAGGAELRLVGITWGREHRIEFGDWKARALDRIPARWVPNWKWVQGWRTGLSRGGAVGSGLERGFSDALSGSGYDSDPLGIERESRVAGDRATVGAAGGGTGTAGRSDGSRHAGARRAGDPANWWLGLAGPDFLPGGTGTVKAVDVTLEFPEERVFEFIVPAAGDG